MATGAITESVFLVDYPEFADLATTPLLTAKLAEANAQTGSDWGTLQSNAAGLLCAHLLAISPEAEPMAAKAGIVVSAVQVARPDLGHLTNYLSERSAMARRVFVPLLVAGS